MRRDRVSFTGDLRFPIRFREAVSALHAVVVSDLKYKAKDRSAYQEYLKLVRERENAIRRMAFQKARQELRAVEPEPMPVGLESRFKAAREILVCTPSLQRLPVEKRPFVVAAAGPVRSGRHRGAGRVVFRVLQQGRVELRLPDGGPRRLRRPGRRIARHDKRGLLAGALRRVPTVAHVPAHRFAVDPTGFEVATQGAVDYREEKIDLPPSWLRGFMQLQAAMSVVARRVRVSREGLFNLLAYLKRHRTRSSPRRPL